MVSSVFEKAAYKAQAFVIGDVGRWLVVEWLAIDILGATGSARGTEEEER